MITMPERLTAENGAKGLLSGDFSITIQVHNPDYCGCGDKEGDCDFCDEFPDASPTLPQEIPVPWTVIKAIYAKAADNLKQDAKVKELVKATKTMLHELGHCMMHRGEVPHEYFEVKEVRRLLKELS